MLTAAVRTGLRAAAAVEPTFARAAVSGVVVKRFINLHEYQSKELMEKYGVVVQRFRVGSTPEEVEKGAKELKTSELVLKAQIHAGGRGKGHFDNGFKGGVHFPKDPQEAKKMAEQMLGYRLVTKQTPKEGVLVRKLSIAESLPIARETYFAILYDRAVQGPVMMGSSAGGMDIEEVAHKTPEKICVEPIDIMKGPSKAQTEKLAKALGFKGELIPKAQDQMERLYKLFMGVDATQVEINPFGETPDGRVVCFDAKINFDDSAMFRQKKIYEQRDEAETDPREIEAQKYDLNFVGLDGNIGCLVNGAGLAMATTDLVHIKGGSPANFLDLGGGASEKAVTEAFKILVSDPKVKAIFVNIFGGIVKCDMVAKGIVGAAKKTGLKVPLIVRLRGTNQEAGAEVLKKSGLRVYPQPDLGKAAEMAVKAARDGTL
jgi:succinyl-CoA synthetase beta subunit